MSGRTRKTMIAQAFGEEIPFQTAGGYTVAGVLMKNDAEHDFPRAIVAVGHSWDSVTRRTMGASRKERPGIARCDHHYVAQVVTLIEATAPVIRDYFGTHTVYVTGWYSPQTGWECFEKGSRSAGSSALREMIRDGATAFEVTQRMGGGQSRVADFQAAELLKSMNARRAA